MSCWTLSSSEYFIKIFEFLLKLSSSGSQQIYCKKYKNVFIEDSWMYHNIYDSYVHICMHIQTVCNMYTHVYTQWTIIPIYCPNLCSSGPSITWTGIKIITNSQSLKSNLQKLQRSVIFLPVPTVVQRICIVWLWA